MMRINTHLIINNLRQAGDTIKTQFKIASSLLAHLSAITNSGMHSADAYTSYHNRGKPMGQSANFVPKPSTTTSPKQDKHSFGSTEFQPRSYSSSTPVPMPRKAAPVPMPRKAAVHTIAPKPVIEKGRIMTGHKQSVETTEKLANNILMNNRVQPGVNATLIAQLEQRIKNNIPQSETTDQVTRRAVPENKQQAAAERPHNPNTVKNNTAPTVSHQAMVDELTLIFANYRANASN